VILCLGLIPPSERRTSHFRAHERRALQLQAAVWHPGRVDQAQAYVFNIGLGGAGVACATSLRPDDRVMLTLFSTSLLDPLALAARVAWVQTPQQTELLYAGFAFEAPERHALLTLFQLISALTF